MIAHSVLRKFRARKVCILGYLFLFSVKWRQSRRWGVHPINRSRSTKGEFATLVNELEDDPERYHQYFRMTKDRFEFILRHIEDKITGQITNFKTPMSPKEKLVVCLKFLATGSTYAELAFRFRMGSSTVRKIVMETVDAINTELMHIMLPRQTKNSWKNICESFYKRWNFPNCVGAADGKHVVLFCPPKSGSRNFNYKKTFSLNFMAVVGAHYQFVMIDVGADGSHHDATVFWNSGFGKKWFFQDSALNLPPPSPLPLTQTTIPYQLIADDAFGQKTTIMTPYPGANLWTRQRILNYRLSRALRVVENAFGILTHTWRILLKRIEASEESSKKIVFACCILHNFLKFSMSDIEHSLRGDDDDEEMVTLPISRSTSSNDTMQMRNTFAEWCVKEGDVGFQYKMI